MIWGTGCPTTALTRSSKPNGHCRLRQRSAVAAPEDRVRFLKLAWDAVGSEFGSRHTQYEMFYAGAPFVTCGHSFRTYDWPAADALVQRILEGYRRG